MQGRQRNSAQGLTLLELLITLAILAILACVAIPSMTSLIEKQGAQLVSQGLVAQMRAARELAVVAGKYVILCGTRDNTTCSKNHFQQIMVFIDDNHNYSKEPDEVQLVVRSFDENAGSLQLSASLGKHYLQYSPEGIPNPWGSFIFCPKQTYKRQLIQRVTINRVGRAYIAQPIAQYGEVSRNEEKFEAINCD